MLADDLIMFPGATLRKQIVKIAFTGAPSSGKTSIIPYIASELTNRGKRPIIVPETASMVFGSGFSHRPEDWKHRLDLQRYIFAIQEFHERIYADMLQSEKYVGECIELCDRGKGDAPAYSTELEHLEFLEIINAGHLGRITQGDLLNDYKMVVHLNGSPKYYTTENNASRHEDVELAMLLEKRTLAAWAGHRHHTVIKPEADFEVKKRNAFNSIARVLKLPMAMEKERKFLWQNADISLLPEDSVEKNLDQTYLIRQLGIDERRVRAESMKGHTSYVYTAKTKTGTIGQRTEDEKNLMLSEYLKKLEERDPASVTIKKTRYVFFHEGQKFEVDFYKEPYVLQGDAVVECEVDDLQKPIDFPNFLQNLQEITGDDRYSNREIARGSLG